MQYVAVFVTQYNSSLSSVVPNCRILSQVVAENSLTEKKFTNRQIDKQTDKIVTEKAKTIYPYILCTGGINIPYDKTYIFNCPDLDAIPCININSGDCPSVHNYFISSNRYFMKAVNFEQGTGR